MLRKCKVKCRWDVVRYHKLATAAVTGESRVSQSRAVSSATLEKQTRPCLGSFVENHDTRLQVDKLNVIISIRHVRNANRPGELGL